MIHYPFRRITGGESLEEGFSNHCHADKMDRAIAERDIKVSYELWL